MRSSRQRHELPRTRLVGFGVYRLAANLSARDSGELAEPANKDSPDGAPTTDGRRKPSAKPRIARSTAFRAVGRFRGSSPSSSSGHARSIRRLHATGDNPADTSQPAGRDTATPAHGRK